MYAFSLDNDNILGTRALRSKKTKSIARFLPEGDKPDCTVTGLSPQHEHLVHVHFGTGNEEIIVALPYSDQTMQLMDLVPIAQTFCDAIVEARIKRAKSDGRAVVCRQCLEPLCCQNLIGTSTIQAAYLATKLLNNPSQEALHQVDRCRKQALQLDRVMAQPVQVDSAGRKYFSQVASQLQNAYADLKLSCMFSKDGRCEIYGDRPLTCRHWLVTGSQAHCQSTNVARQYNVDMPVNMNDVLIKTAFRFSGSYEIVTLPAIIDWHKRCSKEYQQGYPSGDLVRTFLESLKDIAQQKAKGPTTIRIEEIR